MSAQDASPGRFVRVAAATGLGFEIFIDGKPVPAVPGDSLLAAILAARRAIRRSDAAGEDRAGYCLMGACQDCWIWQETGQKLRACTTAAEPGMRVCTGAPPGWPTFDDGGAA